MEYRGIDITGKKFGMLTVLRRVEEKVKGHTVWECLCDCGNKTVVTTYRLTSGNTKSCGCLHRLTLLKRNTTHNMSYTRLFKIWAGMHKRCKNPNCAGYARYGAKGICVCDEWSSFEPFRDWAFANGYAEDLSIDRIDNSGNYCPENCRWADRRTQSRNRSYIRPLTYNGVTMLMTDWAEKLGMPIQSLSTRLSHYTVEEALSRPYKRNKPHKRRKRNENPVA